MLGAEPGIESTERVDVGREGRGLRWGVLAAVVIVLLVLGGLVLGGDDGEDGESATHDRRTTTTRRPTSTTASTAPPVTAPHGPQLPVPTGVALLMLDERQHVVHLDLDTGTRTELDLDPGVLPDYYAVRGVRGGVVLIDQSSNQKAIYQPLPAGEATVLGSAFELVPTPQLDAVWLVRDDGTGFEGAPSAPRVQLVGLDGEARTRELQLGDGYVAGAADAGLVVSAGGRVYLVSPDGTVEPLATGDVLAVGGHWALLRTCDDRARCAGTVLDLDTGRTSPSPFELPPANFGFEGSVSAAGELAAVEYGPNDSDLLMGTVERGELGRVEIASFFGAAQGGWLPDGLGLITGTSSGRGVQRVFIGEDGEVHTEPIRALTDEQVQFAVLIHPR